MSNDLAGLLLDVVVLVLLGMTIYYVVRLTKGLNDFKKHRQEFDSVIANLLTSIDQADHSIRTLKTVSAQEAGRLELSIAQAKALCDELKIITEAGESMAKRLEKLAETNRKIVQSAPDMTLSPEKVYKTRKSAAQQSSYEHRSQDKISSRVYQDAQTHDIEQSDDYARDRKTTSSYGQTLKRVEKKHIDTQKDLPSFMVGERDSRNFKSPQSRKDSVADRNESDDKEEKTAFGTLRSQAEKELMDALRTTRKNISGNE